MAEHRGHDQLLPVALPDGSTVFVEVTATGSGGDATASRKGLNLTSVRDDLTRLSQFLVETLTTAFTEPPQRYGVEFGVKLAVQSGQLVSVLAQATAEAAIKVSLEWERPSPAPAAPTGR